MNVEPDLKHQIKAPKPPGFYHFTEEELRELLSKVAKESARKAVKQTLLVLGSNS